MGLAVAASLELFRIVALADAIAARDEAVVAARDRAHYHADMAEAEATVYALAEAAAVEVAAKRVHWDSSLAEALECRKRHDELFNRWHARRNKCVRHLRFDDGK
ncbi:hypothetical protein QYE76_024079 [Lolium multiflorum]|uniref:Uncharacterized protein n=1 Tax=Lolium multiflorum TaxID=4521 RepID=A0AAD8RCN7_LOLMU|nr:hypothetical protein QYE76_024079 [Lolium multiflorum]